MAKSATKYTVVKAGERIDSIAKRVYGNSAAYVKLIQANPTLNVWNPTPGQKVVIPDA